MNNRRFYKIGLFLSVAAFVGSFFLPRSMGDTPALIMGLGMLCFVVFLIALIVSGIRAKRQAKAAAAAPSAIAVPDQPSADPIPASPVIAARKERFLFYDVETPNRRNDSICAVGWALYEDNVRTAQDYQLIDPRAPFDLINTQIHGIHPADVSGAPSFGEYWKDKLGAFMASATVVAHNAKFDMSVTAKALAADGIEMPDINYLDSVPAFRALCPGESCKLPDLAARYGYEYQAHHAGEDTAMLAAVISAACRENGYSGFPEFFKAANVCAQTAQAGKPEEQAAMPASSYENYLALVQQIIDNAKSKHVDLTDIHFAFHGNPQKPVIGRKNGLDRIVEALGGVFHDNISGKLDYYVCFDDEETGTVLKARSIQQDPRYHLHIIDTEAFFRIIGYGTNEPDHDGPAEIRRRKQLEREAQEAAIREKEAARAQKEALKAERKAQVAEKKPRQPKGRAVRQLDMDGNIINEYPSIAIAAVTVGVNAKSIRDVLDGKQKRAGGYRWEEVNADIQQDNE